MLVNKKWATRAYLSINDNEKEKIFMFYFLDTICLGPNYIPYNSFCVAAGNTAEIYVKQPCWKYIFQH